MTTPYSKLDEESKQGATPLGQLEIVEGDGSMSQSCPTAEATVTQNGGLRCLYILLMLYGIISIFFSLLLGIIAFALAYYAWYEHKDGNPRNGLVMAAISFVFSTLSIVVPVIFFVLMSLRII